MWYVSGLLQWGYLVSIQDSTETKHPAMFIMAPMAKNKDFL